MPAFDHTPLSAGVANGCANETCPILSNLYDGLYVDDPLIKTFGAVADFLSSHLEAL